MKNSLFSILALFVGVGIGYLIFNVKKESVQVSDSSKELAKGWIGSCGLADPATQLCLNDAHAMVLNYDPKKIDNFENTRTVWLPYNRIVQLYEYLKKDYEDGKTGTDGLRIYFARYPQTDQAGVKYEHPNYNTLVFVSTKKNKADTTKHDDYYVQVGMITPENKGELCPPGDCPTNGARLLDPKPLPLQ